MFSTRKALGQQISLISQYSISICCLTKLMYSNNVDSKTNPILMLTHIRILEMFPCALLPSCQMECITNTELYVKKNFLFP